MSFKMFLAALALALSSACSNEIVVAPGGPAVHDQLNSRGYITPPEDTIPRADTSGLKLDSL
jgi:uncharacterized lipoprotein NlpE involved in copper resistance